VKFRALLWLLLEACALAACQRKPGGFCEPREAHCRDSTTALLCSDGTFTAVPCRGKDGCVSRDGKTSCDISGNRAGDRCSLDDQGVAVCASADALLVCRGEAFVSAPCRGPRGCEMVGDRPRCDQSVAAPGEACKAPGAKACSSDATRVLSCSGERMTELYLCRGQAQCRADAGKVACDQTVAHLGDRCDKSLAGHVACSDDKRSLVTCKDGRFVFAEKCKLGTLCAVDGQSTRCERR
jgi:hypothetical protein